MYSNLEIEKFISLRDRAVEYMAAVSCLGFLSIAVIKTPCSRELIEEIGYLAYGSEGG